jgi:hypothetical protein
LSRRRLFEGDPINRLNRCRQCGDTDSVTVAQQLPDLSHEGEGSQRVRRQVRNDKVQCGQSASRGDDGERRRKFGRVVEAVTQQGVTYRGRGRLVGGVELGDVERHAAVYVLPQLTGVVTFVRGTESLVPAHQDGNDVTEPIHRSPSGHRHGPSKVAPVGLLAEEVEDGLLGALSPGHRCTALGESGQGYRCGTVPKHR